MPLGDRDGCRVRYANAFGGVVGDYQFGAFFTRPMDNARHVLVPWQQAAKPGGWTEDEVVTAEVVW
jgi:hypothetical protein